MGFAALNPSYMLRQHRAANRDGMAGFYRTIRHLERGWA
jgi:hypothetical protein